MTVIWVTLLSHIITVSHISADFSRKTRFFDLAGDFSKNRFRNCRRSGPKSLSHTGSFQSLLHLTLCSSSLLHHTGL
ncbi:hypothetical protein BC629DRAFT_1549472 [Irpex lacteus]|nr:hypothetical protein BC629DRAFT_1549472 [Irpex lacteus]